MNIPGGVWLSINEYSHYKRVSISTIRRRIKNNTIKFKDENGKYYIFVSSMENLKELQEDKGLKKTIQIEELQKQIKKLQEENSELKMLVNLYEGSLKKDGVRFHDDLIMGEAH